MKSKQHHFSVELAVKVGVERATLMANIEYWLDWSKAHNKNVNDGYHWTYNSASAFAELFPYMSKHTIGRHLKILEEDGFLISGVFNKAGYDRTKWYTTPDYLILQNCNMDIAEVQNGSCRSATPIPYVNTVNKPDSKPVDRFNEFWDSYAKKTGRPKCESKFKKLKPEEVEKIFAALPAYIASTPDKKYRKNPETWLGNKCWDDEIINNVMSVSKQNHNIGSIDHSNSGGFAKGN